MDWNVTWAFLLAIAVLWDLASLKMAITGVRTRRGPSGIPVLSWIVYMACFGYGEVPFNLSKTEAAWIGAALTAFHVGCHLAIPWAYSRIRRRRRT